MIIHSLYIASAASTRKIIPIDRISPKNHFASTFSKRKLEFLNKARNDFSLTAFL